MAAADERPAQIGAVHVRAPEVRAADRLVVVVAESRVAQVGGAQISVGEVNALQVRAYKAHAAGPGAAQIASRDRNARQIPPLDDGSAHLAAGAVSEQASELGVARIAQCVAQIDARQLRAGEVGSANVRAAKVDAGEPRVAEIRSAQVGAAKIGARKVGAAQTRVAQIGAREIGSDIGGPREVRAVKVAAGEGTSHAVHRKSAARRDREGKE